jgi:peptidoglycan/LPS O-acetylase OafA/YrhL
MATVQRPLPLPHLRELDGIRGIAALLVFFHHLCSASIHTDNWAGSILILRSIFKYGTTGVDIFFVLSGFLITSLLIRDRESPAYYKDFYWKRALRILPLYLLCLLGVLFFIPGSGAYVLMAALFVVNFANVFHVSTSGPFWSLAIEEQFYLVWPTVVRRRSVSSLSYWAIAIALASIVLRFVSARSGHYNYFLTPLRADGLAVGALIACRFERRQREGVSLSADDRYFGLALLAGAVLIGVAVMTPIAGDAAMQAAFQQAGISCLCGGGIGLVIAHSGSAALAVLRSHLLTFFGLISYAFYMTHLYVMSFYEYVRGEIVVGDTHGYFVRLAVVFVGSVGLSLVSRYVLELPVLSLRRYVLSRPAPKAETEEPLFAK